MKIDGYYVLEDNKYNSIKSKELNWVKTEVKTLSRVISNRKTKYEHTDEFFLTINVSDKVNVKDDEINNFLQSVFSASVDNYYYYNRKEYIVKSYYHVSKGYDEKKEDREAILAEKLNKVYDFFKVYEKVKDKELNVVLNEYNTDIEQNKVFNTNLLKVFPKEINGKKEYVLLLTGFAENDFFVLKNNAKYVSKIIDDTSKEQIKNQVDASIKHYLISESEVKEFSNKAVGKYYFILNPTGYDEIKKIINREIAKEENFKIMQNEAVEQQDLSRFNVEEENPFDLKIKFDVEKKMFEFYGKGLFNFYNMNTNRVEDKPLFGVWASQFIYMTDQLTVIDKVPNNECKTLEQLKKINVDDDLKKRKDCYAMGDEYDKYKEYGGKKYKQLNLRYHTTSSFKDKTLYIPATDWQEIEIIKNNYENEMKFFRRPEIENKVDLKENIDLTEYKNTPSVFFTSHGDIMLAYNYKKGSSKNVKNMNVKGVAITYAEALYFLENHPLSEYIKENSKYVNNLIHQPATIAQLNDKEVFNYWFDKLMTGTSLKNELLNDSQNIKTKGQKRVKI